MAGLGSTRDLLSGVEQKVHSRCRAVGPAPRLPWTQLVAGACQATCALGPQPRTGQVTFQEKAGGLQGSQLLAWAWQVCPSLPPSLPPSPPIPESSFRVTLGCLIFGRETRVSDLSRVHLCSRPTNDCQLPLLVADSGSGLQDPSREEFLSQRFERQGGKRRGLG